jgi:hypothetical protein
MDASWIIISLLIFSLGLLIGYALQKNSIQWYKDIIAEKSTHISHLNKVLNVSRETARQNELKIEELDRKVSLRHYKLVRWNKEI